MTSLRLLSPSAESREPFLAMAREWREQGSDRYALALESFDAYLDTLRAAESTVQPEGRVPGTERWVSDGDEIVGCVRLRFSLTSELEFEGGHIGYDIRPSARRKGFGTEALRLVLEVARKRGMDRVRLTADADNIPSLHIIERNGGVLSGEAVSSRTGKRIRQYWIDLGG